jgi:hypothetical protein
LEVWKHLEREGEKSAAIQFHERSGRAASATNLTTIWERERKDHPSCRWMSPDGGTFTTDRKKGRSVFTTVPAGALEIVRTTRRILGLLERFGGFSQPPRSGGHFLCLDPALTDS